jgi:secreted trypsin-like serine protease
MLSAVAVGAGNIKPMIIGGERVTRRLYPWSALIDIERYVLCGGSLITPFFVLTAAHCILGQVEDSKCYDDRRILTM